MAQPYDRHLSDEDFDALASLAREPNFEVADIATDDESISDHLSGCVKCRALLEQRLRSGNTLNLIQPDASRERGINCPSDEDWMRLAAGLSDVGSEMLIAHAATCDHCGPFFRARIEDFGDEVDVAERRALEHLRIYEPTRQRRMATTLAGGRDFRNVSGDQSAWLWVQFPLLVRVAVAVCIIALASVGFFVARRFSNSSSIDQLLAQAYAERRTLDVRIPGAAYAPIQIERGSSRSALQKPAALLKAEERIIEGLRRNPEDPLLLEARGRAELLEGDYNSAIQSLQRALELNPTSLSTMTDLGSAYFVRADEANRPSDYANSIEELSKALSQSPDDPLALFNRALANERMFLYSQAVQDWEHYLRTDPDSPWATEARSHLSRLKQKIGNRKQNVDSPLLSADEFARSLSSDQGALTEAVETRVEEYQETAARLWLLQTYAPTRHQAISANTHTSLKYLSGLMARLHDDYWLIDMLRQPESVGLSNAIRELTAGEDALDSGQYVSSEELERRSIQDFESIGSRAGIARASFLLMLAQSVSLKPRECVGIARGLLPILVEKRYRWLAAQVLIQQGQCEGALAREDGAISANSEGFRIAKVYRYPGVQLRATAFDAAYRRELGTSDQPIHALTEGLDTFWRTSVPDVRGDNLYSAFYDVAESRNWFYVEAYLLQERIVDFPTRDVLDLATSLELIGAAFERAGDHEASQKSLKAAASKLKESPVHTEVSPRRAEFAAEAARVQLESGDPQSALQILAPLENQFDVSAPGLFEADYFELYGETLLALGLMPSARSSLSRALSTVETGLSRLDSEASRAEWSRMLSQTYRDLLDVKLASDNLPEAFQWWEWYKCASLRTIVEKSSGQRACSSSDILRQSASTAAGLSVETAIVSYVVCKASVIAFVFRNGQVHFHRLLFSDGPKLRARTFLGLLADPTTDVGIVDAEGMHLYQLLVAPLEPDLSGATRIRFETDGILDSIPFDLLKSTDGRYLSDRFAISYSPGLGYTSDESPGGISPESPTVIVLAEGADRSQYTFLPDSRTEAEEVASHFNKTTVIDDVDLDLSAVRHKLERAEVFHFVGHGVASVNQVGLLLNGKGVLRAADFSSSRFRRLKLATLSACDTATGEEGTPAGVESIARAFVVAGVPETVASRWKIDSESTRKLMDKFYSKLASGDTVSESLRAAAIEIRQLPEYKHPYYWGSFAVFGNN